MVKENKKEFNDLVAYRKKGYGKTAIVDYRFIIDKDYKARIEMKLDREASSISDSTARVKLSEQEKMFVSIFISKFVKPMEDKVPLMETSTDSFEKQDIYYGNIIVEDDEKLNDNFMVLMDFIEMTHDELSSSNLTKMYDDMNKDFNNRTKK